MSTRREMTLALLGLPLASMAVKPDMEPESQTNMPPKAVAGRPAGKKMKPVPLPQSEAAARIISYTIYAEARGEPFEGKRAVAAVIQTRARRSGLSLAETCLRDKQFTCWNDLTEVPECYITGEGIPPKDLEARAECYGIAWVLMVTKHKWKYLTHFYNPDKATPDWAYEMKGTRTIGNHVFGYIN